MIGDGSIEVFNPPRPAAQPKHCDELWFVRMIIRLRPFYMGWGSDSTGQAKSHIGRCLSDWRRAACSSRRDGRAVPLPTSPKTGDLRACAPESDPGGGGRRCLDVPPTGYTAPLNSNDLGSGVGAPIDSGPLQWRNVGSC